ncbi:hypothetical protein J437_LFUL012492 [Ladona fulva]|uniref:Solute carrier organic anion transporter family member 4A1 n=1 Tax=Ladona fulva TaxID=123851 RepID=A0A8K0KEB3_LADFU|nr:hypothetical protein J437_LFUL012492 [Ladona fulva]
MNDLLHGVCGIGPCSPGWLQMFASKQAFLVIFCITWVLQGMYYTYFVSVITTIEKLFQIQSKTTGIIMSATEVGQIGSSLLLTYYGGQGHRPRWIAWGMVLFALSSFTCALPHFIFGDQLLQANSGFILPQGPPGGSFGAGGGPGVALSLQSSSALASAWNSTVPSAAPLQSITLPTIPDLCADEGFLWENGTEGGRWVRGKEGAGGKKKCEDGKVEGRIQSRITTVVLAMFFVSLLGVGMGQTAVNTLGIPYIDDNVASRESPLYFDWYNS